MLDWTRITGFDWDEGNRRKSSEKHAITQAEAEHVFLDPKLLIFSDESHSSQEERFHAYGETAGRRRLLVSFTLRNDSTLIRVISARPMSRKERARYEEEA